MLCVRCVRATFFLSNTIFFLSLGRMPYMSIWASIWCQQPAHRVGTHAMAVATFFDVVQYFFFILRSHTVVVDVVFIVFTLCALACETIHRGICARAPVCFYCMVVSRLIGETNGGGKRIYYFLYSSAIQTLDWYKLESFCSSVCFFSSFFSLSFLVASSAAWFIAESTFAHSYTLPGSHKHTLFIHKLFIFFRFRCSDLSRCCCCCFFIRSRFYLLHFNLIYSEIFYFQRA